MCKHLNFKAETTVIRLPNDENNKPTDFAINIKVTCADCFKPFIFEGLTPGVSFHHPTTSIDKTELRAPIKPII